MLPGVYIFTRGGLASTIRVKMPACIVTFTYNVQQRCPEHLALCVSCQYSLSVTFVLFIRCRTMTENRNICGINCRLEFQPMAIVAHYSYRANNVRNLPLLGRIACMHNIDAAYSRCSVVSLSVCVSHGHNRQPYGWTDQDAVWCMERDSGGTSQGNSRPIVKHRKSLA